MHIEAPVPSRVPDASTITLFRERLGVWLTFAGSAYLSLYAERLLPLGLRPNWVTALAIIAERPGITQSALARALSINRASGMAIATLLEASGFLVRESLPGRKQTALQLTKEGHTNLIKACEIEDGLCAWLLDGLTGDQVALLLKTLMHVTDKANGKHQ